MTIDWKPKIDGDVETFDWKTGKFIYPKDKQQQIAYLKPIGGRKANLVHIPAVKPNRKGYRITEVEYTEEKFDLFLATKKVFDSENKDLPKVLTLPLEVNLESLTKE